MVLLRLLCAVFLTACAAACADDSDCLLLGSCEGGVCHCRQGFTGEECGQLDFGAAPAHLGYHNQTASTWGGLPLKVRGEWHLFVSMITGDCPLGAFNNNSEIAHLVSAGGGGWEGPYELQPTTVVPSFAHNAAPQLLPDGSIGVWFIGYDGAVDTISCPNGVPPADFVWPDWSGKQIGLALSASGEPSGPWNVTFLFDRPRLPADWWHWDCGATNPSAVVAADGSVTMLYRGTMCTHCDGCPAHPANATERLGIATAPTVAGPYARAAAQIDLGENAEDPFYWRGANGSHHLIAHGGPCPGRGGGKWCGVVASSADGTSWRTAKAAAYGPNVTLTNGTVITLYARQRPQLLFESQPEPAGAGAQGERVLLGLVNGAQLGGGSTFMQNPSFTLMQPVAQKAA